MAPQNFKVTMETDELQRRIAELCDINADLQVPSLSVHYEFCILLSIITPRLCLFVRLSHSVLLLFILPCPQAILSVYPPSFLTKWPSHCKSDSCRSEILCRPCCHFIVLFYYCYVTVLSLSSGANSLFWCCRYWKGSCDTRGQCLILFCYPFYCSCKAMCGSSDHSVHSANTGSFKKKL